MDTTASPAVDIPTDRFVRGCTARCHSPVVETLQGTEPHVQSSRIYLTVEVKSLVSETVLLIRCQLGELLRHL